MARSFWFRVTHRVYVYTRHTGNVRKHSIRFAGIPKTTVSTVVSFIPTVLYLRDWRGIAISVLSRKSTVPRVVCSRRFWLRPLTPKTVFLARSFHGPRSTGQQRMLQRCDLHRIAVAGSINRSTSCSLGGLLFDLYLVLVTLITVNSRKRSSMLREIGANCLPQNLNDQKETDSCRCNCSRSFKGSVLFCILSKL